MHQIDKNLFAVVVPVEATIIEKFKDTYISFYMDGCHYENLGFEFEIKSEITHDSISFDCEPYVEKNGTYDGHSLYKSYANPFGADTPIESFRSLLKSKGLYWDNAAKPKILSDSENSASPKEYADWQSAEASKLTKEQKLIIIEKI